MKKLSLALGLFLAAPAVAADMNLSKDMLAALSAAIVAEGYNCPEAKYARSEGQDAYGNVMRIYCGAAGSPETFAQYRLTIKPDESYAIAVWQ